MEMNIQNQNASIQARAAMASDIIAKHGRNTIVLFDTGEQYETYNESAEQVHTHCKFEIIHYGDMAYVDFKKWCDFWVFPKLVREGYKICILEKGTY